MACVTMVATDVIGERRDYGLIWTERQQRDLVAGVVGVESFILWRRSEMRRAFTADQPREEKYKSSPRAGARRGACEKHFPRQTRFL